MVRVRDMVRFRARVRVRDQ